MVRPGDAKYGNLYQPQPVNFDYSAQGVNTQNPYADRLMRQGQATKNPYANAKNLAIGNNQLNPMANQWKKQTGMFDRLMGQTMKGLDEEQLRQNLRGEAADRTSRATSAGVMAAKEAGMSPAEQAQMRMQGSLRGADALRQADLSAEAIGAQRRGAAQSALGFARSPAERLGMAEIGAGESAAGRKYGAGSQYAGAQNVAEQSLLNRIMGMGERAAGQEYAAGQAEAGRQLSGMGTGMQYGSPVMQGYGGTALMGGTGMDMSGAADPQADWMQQQQENMDEQNKLSGDVGKYYRRMINANDPTIVPSRYDLGGWFGKIMSSNNRG